MQMNDMNDKKEKEKNDSTDDYKKNFKDRRKGPDFWLKLVRVFSIVNFILIGAILFIADSAMPNNDETFFDRLFEVNRQSAWDFTHFKFIFILIIILFLGSGISLIANLKKMRRKTDRISFSNLISFILAGIGIIVYVLYFF